VAPVSNLDPETSYPDLVVKSLEANAGIVPQNNKRDGLAVRLCTHIPGVLGSNIVKNIYVVPSIDATLSELTGLTSI
jgi:hypothetical protein